MAITAILVATVLAGCTMPTADENGAPTPSTALPAGDPEPESYGPLVEGMIFTYYHAEEDAWLNVTILDVNATRHGNVTIETRGHWTKNSTTHVDAIVWYDRSTLARADQMEDGLAVRANCPLFSVYPVEEREFTCRIFANGQGTHYEWTLTKVAVHETYMGPLGNYDTVHTKWGRGEDVWFEGWYAPDLGFFVRLNGLETSEERVGWAELQSITFP